MTPEGSVTVAVPTHEFIEYWPETVSDVAPVLVAIVQLPVRSPRPSKFSRPEILSAAAIEVVPMEEPDVLPLPLKT